MLNARKLVVGLETHVQLRTATKLFCSCAVEFDAEPNTRVCPICAGHPGTLPVLNKEALRKAILAGLALASDISEYTQFDRKNYFYPDLPKGFQITQSQYPLCRGGSVVLGEKLGGKRIRIRQIHLEEDSGRSQHDSSTNTTLVDLNRCGVPLIEIVTEPDLSSSQEVYDFLTRLKTILRFADISDCEMQKGELRVDVNLSVKDDAHGISTLPCEVKNLNSISSAARAVEFECRRHCHALDTRSVTLKETRGWDDIQGITYPMRSKEATTDYRFISEPDLPPIYIPKSFVDEVRCQMPELPDALCRRLISEYGLSGYEADVLMHEPETTRYFEAAAMQCGNGKECAKWILGDISSAFGGVTGVARQSKIPPLHLAELVSLVSSGRISLYTARTFVLRDMIETGKSPAIIAAGILTDSTTNTELAKHIDAVIEQNPVVVADIKSGRTKAIEVLVGKLMQATMGSFSPLDVRRELLSRFAKVKIGD